MGFKHIQMPKFYDESIWHQQIYVENSVGDIYQNGQSDAQFQSEWLTSWILIPLLNTMRQTLGKKALIESFMPNFDYEYDILFSPQSNTRFQLNPEFSCALANSKLGITGFNNTFSKVNQFYAYYPLIQQYMEDAIDMVDHVHQEMEKDVGPVRIRPEFFGPFNQPLITGPSVQFERSALGMTTLFTLSMPVSAFFQFTKYFPYEVCYDMLDMRYLNVTTQCFLEYDSKAETIQEISAENLRKYSNILSGMGVIFGIVSGWIVLLFLSRVLQVYRVTKLDDIELSSALKLRIQGPGMISNVETLLMAICTLPLLLDHHIPGNDVFVESSSGTYKFPQEIIVLLSLTWFIRLGVCMGNMLIHLESRSTYFDMIQDFYSQIVLVVIYLIRLAMTVGHADYTGGVVKCGVSVGLCLLFGVIMSVLSKLFDQRTIDASDPIDKILGTAHLSRSMNCVIGKTGNRWVLSEMLMDKWTIENIKSQFRLLCQTSTCVIQIQQEKPYSNNATIIELMRILSKNEHDFTRKKSLVVPDKISNGPAATNIRTGEPTGLDRRKTSLITTQRQSNHRFGSKTMIAKFLVLAQAIWLVVVPIKNVVIVPWPQTYPDGISTTQTEYQGYSGFQENDYMTGREIIDVLERIINITFENEAVLRRFNETRRFSMDSIVNLVSVEDHVYVSKYLQLLHQTDFQPGRMISYKEDFVLHKSDSGININITAICTPEDALLNGMVCTNSNGKPCNDWFDTPDKTNFTFVNLSSYQTNTSLRNTFAIYQVVVYFQQSMEQLFRTLDWNMVKDWYFTYCYSYPIISAPENETMVFENYFDFIFLYRQNWDRNYTLYNCGLTEQLLVLIYIPNYIINMIQQGMGSHGLSFQTEDNASINWFDTTRELQKMARVDERMTDLVFNERLYFTSSAKHISYSHVTTSLENTLLTDTRTSVYANKFYRTYGAGMSIGNPQMLLKNYARRNLHEIVSFFDDDQERNISTKKLYLGGTWWSFIEYIPNRGVHAARLRETTIAENASFLPGMVQEEAKYVNWFRNFEKTDDRAIAKIIMKYLDYSTSNHLCHMHLLRKMTQVLWLMGLSQMLANHIAYIGIVDGVREYTWTLNRMQENVIIGENSMGVRFSLPLDGVGNSHISDGSSAWPYAPMLHSFLRFFHDDKLTLKLYMKQMNASFLSLVNVQDGKIDLGGTLCDIGIQRYGITKTDSAAMIYEKLYPAFVNIINETMYSIASYHKQMEKDVGPVGIRDDFFEKFPDMFNLTAMGFGIRKLMSHVEPGDSDIQKLVKAEQCYVMLEGRYLNQTIRCFSDYPSFMEIRKAKNSEGLRVFLGSNYALGVVLNVLSSYVAIRFVFKLFEVYQITGFNDISILLSLDIQAQGPNMMSFSKSFLMATSAVPLLLGYHLPPNKEYIDATQNYSPIVVAFILALSLTWYLQIGVMIGSHLIHLKYYNLWYDAVQSRLRYAVLVVIVIIRYYIRIDDGDYTGGVFVLIFSCILAMGLGIVLAIIAKCFDKKPKFEDPLDAMFIDSKTSRTKIGVLSRTDDGWHLSGLLLEGWRIVNLEGKRVSLMQDCKHMIEVDGEEIVKGMLL